MIEIREYLDRRGRSPFGIWFSKLDNTVAAKVTVALARVGQGNFSNTKGVGKGVLEHKIDYGAGYRIYFGKDGDRLVILLGGGSKRRQTRDIQDAKDRWDDYQEWKRRGK